MKQTTVSLRKKVTFAMLPIGILLTLGVGLEYALRRLPPSPELSTVLFFNQFKLSRWTFLSERHHQLNVDWVLNVIAQPNANYEESPEPNRPAFDKIPYPYHIQTNQLGFRDKNFPMHSAPSILLLGDSVGFGKGVHEDERFFSLLKQSFPHLPFYNLSLQGCTADCMTAVFTKYVDQLNPAVVLVQASSNDIDQTLWREGISMDVPDKPIPILLQWHAKSYLSQWLQATVGTSTVESLDKHSFIVEEHYQESLHSLFESTAKHNVSVLAIDLPFAYNWNYGGHLLRTCAKHTHCTSSSVSLNHTQIKTYETFKTIPTSHRFDIRTAEELNLSKETIEQVFPHPEYFLDVVHLTPYGHFLVADTIRPILESIIQQ